MVGVLGEGERIVGLEITRGQLPKETSDRLARRGRVVVREDYLA